MPPRRFTDTEEAEIAKIYRVGNHSARAIALAYMCNGHTILDALKRQGIDTSARYVRKNLYHFNNHTFDKIDNEQNAYWLGFIYADGHIRIDPPTLIINLNSKDEAHLIKFNKFLDSDYPISKREIGITKDGIKRFGVSLHITDSHFALSLMRLGIVKHRINTYAMATQVPWHLLHHFIRGLFDGDGCIASQRPEILFCGSFELMNWLRLMLHDAIDTNPNQTISQTFASKHLFYLSYGGRLQVNKISDWMYYGATVWLERKRKLFDKHRSPKLGKIKSKDGHQVTSKYRGVSQTHNGKWIAQICYAGNRSHLGTFDNELEAAHAYDEAAKKHHGDRARLNFP